MNTIVKLILGIFVLAASATTWSGDNQDKTIGSVFTGEVLTQLYVTDVRKSVAFYKALGFEHFYYYDYQEETYRAEWEQPYPPEYAEMTQTGIRIGLTTAEEAEPVYGGGVRHYFVVDDVDRHYAMAKGNGIVAEPDEVEVRPWMKFFTATCQRHCRDCRSISTGTVRLLPGLRRHRLAGTAPVNGGTGGT